MCLAFGDLSFRSTALVESLTRLDCKRSLARSRTRKYAPGRSAFGAKRTVQAYIGSTLFSSEFERWMSHAKQNAMISVRAGGPRIINTVLTISPILGEMAE